MEKEGIDQSVDLDKAIGFTEQLERKIEETKEQLRGTNSEEKKGPTGAEEGFRHTGKPHDKLNNIDCFVQSTNYWISRVL